MSSFPDHKCGVCSTMVDDEYVTEQEKHGKIKISYGPYMSIPGLGSGRDVTKWVSCSQKECSGRACVYSAGL